MVRLHSCRTTRMHVGYFILIFHACRTIAFCWIKPGAVIIKISTFAKSHQYEQIIDFSAALDLGFSRLFKRAGNTNIVSSNCYYIETIIFK